MLIKYVPLFDLLVFPCWRFSTCGAMLRRWVFRSHPGSRVGEADVVATTKVWSVVVLCMCHSGTLGASDRFCLNPRSQRLSHVVASCPRRKYPEPRSASSSSRWEGWVVANSNQSYYTVANACDSQSS